MTAITINEPGHPTLKHGKTGVLLVNLGTPEATDARSVRRYLAEFLSDRRVVDYPRLLWLPILYGIILNVRPAKTGRNYEKIWRKESNESPLRYFTRRQAELLSERIATDDLIIEWAMRYGLPSIADKLARLKELDCDRLLIFPLYPQYSGTTTGTVEDKVSDVLKAMSWNPALDFVQPFFDDPDYINALARSVDKASADNGQPEQIILSFHGLPVRYVRQGDPYEKHCQNTAASFRLKMGYSKDFAPIAYQSIFGSEKWLEPTTEGLLIKAAEAGTKHVAVIAPGFVADCIETLEEVGIGLSEIFKAKGGEKLTLIPCLNDSTDMIDLLETLVGREIGECLAVAAQAQPTA